MGYTRGKTFEEFFHGPTYEKLGKKQCKAKLTDPDALRSQCQEVGSYNGLCFYHNMKFKKGLEVKRI